MKNILYVTPEAAPFVHTGGLGEVASALPGSLNSRKQKDVDCRVILPLYGSIDPKYREQMEFLGSKKVRLAWRNQYMGLFRTTLDGVTFYFIDNEYYFHRDRLYGELDDGERFAFFCRAVFEALELMDFVPDILHANDWQTALVPVYQFAVYRRSFTRTVFTIHNVEYQGRYGKDMLGDVIDLPADMNHLVEYEDDVNLMKGAVECADIVTTVSPTYARELTTPEFGWGLDLIIRRNEHKLQGILNGIDTKSYNPSKDRAIEAFYSWRKPAGKALCKAALQAEAGLPAADVPVMAMVTRMVPAKGMDLLVERMDKILSEMDIQFVLLGTGNPEYEAFFPGLQSRHPDRAACMIRFDSALSHRIYAGADMFLMPSRSEACGLAQMIACRYGTVPIVHQTGGLADSISDCSLGSGNGFVFSRFSGDDMEDAVRRAVQLYGDKGNWTALVDHDMKLNFGWKKAAEQYVRMYGRLEGEQ